MKAFLFAIMASLLLAGCATQNTSARVYTGALQQQTVGLARIVGMRNVEIKPTGNSTGKYVGAAIGTAAGYGLTQGSSNWGVRGAAAILGGALGGQIGQSATHRPRAGVQVFVQRLRNDGSPYGSYISVVQDNDQTLHEGQLVFLIRSSDGYSITAAQ